MSTATRPAAGARATGIVLALALAFAALPGLSSAASAPADASANPSPSPSGSPSPSPSPPPPSAAPAGPTPLTGPVIFYGRGYGHGVGLSQWGARGRALDGQDAPTILTHYYQGATLGPMAPGASIRVLVMSGFAPSAGRPFRIFGRGGAWTMDGIGAAFPADAVLELTPGLVATATGTTTMAWGLTVTAPDGTRLVSRDAVTDLRVRPASSATLLQLWSKPTAYDTYRGALRILPRATGTVMVINELPLELYLLGVVPVEMPSSWPPEALRAQSIAARSYAARRLHPTTGTWDVTDAWRSQVYRGSLAEQGTATAAVLGTTGTVLWSGSTVANALFHSAGGGATENSENVFVSASGARVTNPVSYLRGSADRRLDGSAFDLGSPYATWHTAAYSVDALSAMFAADTRTDVGTILALDLRDRGVSGRLISVTLLGSKGTKKVSADIFRSVFEAHRPATDAPLRSNLFDLAPIP